MLSSLWLPSGINNYFLSIRTLEVLWFAFISLITFGYQQPNSKSVEWSPCCDLLSSLWLPSGINNVPSDVKHIHPVVICFHLFDYLRVSTTRFQVIPHANQLWIAFISLITFGYQQPILVNSPTVCSCDLLSSLWLPSGINNLVRLRCRFKCVVICFHLFDYLRVSTTDEINYWHQQSCDLLSSLWLPSGINNIRRD